MEPEFEPAVRTEQTPEALIVEINVPGFRREDLKVRANNRGSLVISGERGAKEKEGGRLEKMQKAGYTFTKVISIPQNLNFDGITAMFRNETLRVSLPLLHVSDQQNQDTLPGSEKPDQSLESRVERSSPAVQQNSMKEQPIPAPVQDGQSTRHPEAIRQNDDKEKSIAKKDSNELLEKKSVEAPKQAKDLVGEPPISSHAQAVSDELGLACRSEEDGGKKSGKPLECKHPPHEKKEEACGDHGKPSEKSQPLECKYPPHEKKKGCADDGNPAEKSHHVAAKDGVSGIVKRYIPHQSYSTWLTNKFPHQKRIKFRASCSSTFSKRGVLKASSVLVLSVGAYITYKSRRRHHS